MRIRHFAISLEATDASLVERPGPGLAPTAFRIWAAGENTSDDGPTLFTPKSADLLLAEQAARGRLYPSDFDHLSLVSNRPAEAGRASGYHRLEVRTGPMGPELWAVDIEWCADVKAGLEEQPPRWKYFSPAFKQDAEGEVFSYINFAVCINPKTHDLPSLAGIGNECKPGDTGMNKKAMKAFLAKMAEGASDEGAKTAYATIAAALGDDDGDEKKPEAKAEGDDKPESKETEKKSEGEDDATEKKAEGDEKKEPEEKKNAIGAAVAAELAKANAKIAQLEIKAMLDARPDISESLRKWALTQDAETVRGFLANAPKGSAPRNEKVTTTQSDTTRAVGLQGAELEFMNQAMGIGTSEPKGPTVDEHGQFTLHTVKPGDMAKLNITKEKV